MHATTLNENTASHIEHVHELEEIILVIKGEFEESINGVQHKAGPGSIILLMNNDSPGIRNIGKGECEYFAFEWTKADRKQVKSCRSFKLFFFKS